MDEKEKFLIIWKAAYARFKDDPTRLAGEGWDSPWKLLITTVMSAQSRDETTIPIAEGLFEHYPTVESLANANYGDVLNDLKSMNYNRTKAKHVILGCQYLVEIHGGDVPDTLEELVKIPGVGLKTANLVLGELYDKDAICVDTHVHRISNVLGLIKTKTPDQTEKALKMVVPRELWNKLNRIFVLWGKKVAGYDAEKLLNEIGLDRSLVKVA